MTRRGRNTTELPLLKVTTRRQWRAWLAKHHASSRGVRLLCHKQHTGSASLSYEDLVREALCFGWIDSLVRSLDDRCYTRTVTPRRAGSKWSDSNRARWAELESAGLLAPAGVKAAPTSNRYERPVVPVLPAYIARAFKANAQAWAFFQTLASARRRYFVAWIHTAKRPETRAKRIRESIARLAAGRTLGLK